MGCKPKYYCCCKSLRFESYYPGMKYLVVSWICNCYSLNHLLSWVEPTEICFFEIFQIVDLQVFASPRITLKPLVPTFPCFAKILVSLMEKVWQLIIRLNYSGVCVWIILVHHLFANCDWFCSHMLTLG
jgi:hypothetical protein